MGWRYSRAECRYGIIKRHMHDGSDGFGQEKVYSIGIMQLCGPRLSYATPAFIHPTLSFHPISYYIRLVSHNIGRGYRVSRKTFCFNQVNEMPSSSSVFNERRRVASRLFLAVDMPVEDLGKGLLAGALDGVTVAGDQGDPVPAVNALDTLVETGAVLAAAADGVP